MISKELFTLLTLDFLKDILILKQGFIFLLNKENL